LVCIFQVVHIKEVDLPFVHEGIKPRGENLLALVVDDSTVVAILGLFDKQLFNCIRETRPVFSFDTPYSFG